MEMGQWVMGHGSDGSLCLDWSHGWPIDLWWNNCAI